jgi:hypothetical protein
MRGRVMIVGIGAGVILAAVLLLRVTTRRQVSPVPPAEAVRAVPAASSPRLSPGASFTATPEPEAARRATFVVAWEAEPTPTATPTEEPVRKRPGPSPTPDVSQCVATESSASMLGAAPGQVLVDITATNNCNRDLGPLDVWFWVGGYRQGALVQSVRGHPFDPIPRDGEAEVHIGLPGSIDWYDRIEVRVIPPGS